MKIKKSISIISGFLLTATLISLINVNLDGSKQSALGQGGGIPIPVGFFGGNTYGPDPILANLNIGSDYEGNDYSVDMDADGNQIYAWTYDTPSISTDIPDCKGIKYQKFNKIGQPLTGPQIVNEDCNGNKNYYTVKVKTSSGGGNIFIWLSQNIGENTWAIQGSSIDKNNNLLINDPFTVNDDLGSLDHGTLPQLAIDKQTAENNTNFAVAWYACGTNNCTNGSPSFKTQVYNIDLTAHSGPTRVNSNNLDFGNPTSVLRKGIPATAISFSRNRYLLSWISAGTNSTNIVSGKTMSINGVIDDNAFAISDDITGLNSENVSVAGSNRAFTSDNISNVFYATWDQSTDTINSNVILRKITCDNSTVPVCSTTTRDNGEKNTVRVNTNTTDTAYQPTVAVFQNQNDTTKIYGNEKTASDYVAVSWFKETIIPRTCPPDITCLPNIALNVKTQQFNNNLGRLGSERAVTDNSSGIKSIPRLGISQKPETAMSEDGETVIAYDMNGGLANSFSSTVYRNEFQKLTSEKLIHASSPDVQSLPSVAMSDDGNHVIAYQYYNVATGDYDIVFSIYDKYGNAIQNNTIANNTTDGVQENPSVAYFTDSVGSPNHGKFIIAWDNQASGVFYRIFNADGTPATDDTEVNPQVGQDHSNPSVSAGLYKQFIITYREASQDNATIRDIYYEYHNNDTLINGVVNTDTGSAPHAPMNAKVFLNPKANNDNIDNSQFVVTWEENVGNVNEVFIREGQLTSSSLTSLGNVQTIPDSYSPNISGANLPFLSSVHNGPNGEARNPFMYAIVYQSNPSSNNLLLADYTFDQGILNGPISVQSSMKDIFSDNSIAVDKNTGNIVVGAFRFNDFSGSVNNDQVLYTNNSGALNFKKNDVIIDNQSLALGKVVNTDKVLGNYLTISDISNGHFNTLDYKNVTDPVSTIYPIQSDYINDFSPLNPDTNTQTLSLKNINSNGFKSGQKVYQTFPSPAQGTITNINNINGTIDLSNVSGNFVGSYIIAETEIGITEAPIAGVAGTVKLNLVNVNGNDYASGDIIIDMTTGAMGSIYATNESFVDVNISNGTFNTGDNFALIPNKGTADLITKYLGEIDGQFYRLRLANDNSQTFTEPFGPYFRANNLGNYGEQLGGLSIGFDSSSSNADGHYAVFSYATINTTSYEDNNGVYSQLFRDPFSLGDNQNLSPKTEQQVTPGGKYIVVPPIIDFHDIRRGGTGTVDFKNLTPPHIEVTDLDGSYFDLTASLTDLVNSTDASQVIPSSNFGIDNNNGTDPLVSSPYSDFTNVDDVTLDPSTSPGQNANLGTPKTLLKKNTNSTGVFDTVPKVYLSIPGSASTGIYQGTLTLTLT